MKEFFFPMFPRKSSKEYDRFGFSEINYFYFKNIQLNMQLFYFFIFYKSKMNSLFLYQTHPSFFMNFQFIN